MTERHRQFLANALTAVLVIALGLQLAWWFWQFAAPRTSIGAVATENALAVDMAAAKSLFGGDSAPATQASTSGIRLKGVYAADGKSLSAAVVNVGGRDQTVSVGQSFGDGNKLTEVHANHIVVSRNGDKGQIDERIELDRYRTNDPGARGSGAPNTGFRLTVANPSNNNFSLSRRELNTVLQDPRQLEFLGRIGASPNGGIRIDDAPANSLSGKLGFKAGDIITSINGQPVNSPGDLARYYQQFGTLTGIRAEVKRGGVPMLLSYTIQN
jgi:general secretion pathway protein C